MYDESSALKPKSTLSDFQVFHALLICLTGFLEGYMLCVINSLLAPIQRALAMCFPCEGGDSDAALADCTCPTKSLVVAVLMAGAAIGGLAGGFLADSLGRKNVVLLAAALFLAVAVLCSMATPELVGLFIAGRLLVGLCIGAGGTASIALIAETAPREYRGMFIQAVELSLCVGCVCATLLSLLLGDGHWRVTMGIPGVLAILQLLGGAALLHESPAWLDHRGRHEEARRACVALGLPRRTQKAAQQAGGNALAVRRFRRSLSMVAPVPEDTTAKESNAQNARALCVAVGCALAHSALAANAVLYYSRDILQTAGVANPLGAELFVGFVKCAGVITALLYVDRYGRKPLLLLGNTGALFGHLGLAATFYLQPANALLALFALFVFIFSWDLSWAGLMFMVAAEVLPLSIRGVGLGLVSTVYWSLSFCWAFFLEGLFDTLGLPASFLLLACTTMCSLLFVTLLVVESREGDGATPPPPVPTFKRNASTSFQHLLAEDREAAEPEPAEPRGYAGEKEGYLSAHEPESWDEPVHSSWRVSESARDADSWREVRSP